MKHATFWLTSVIAYRIIASAHLDDPHAILCERAPVAGVLLVWRRDEQTL